MGSLVPAICAFCGKNSGREIPMFSGKDILIQRRSSLLQRRSNEPAIYVCNDCVLLFQSAIKAATVPGVGFEYGPSHQCSFCGAFRISVSHMVLVNGSRICDRCLNSCSEIAAVRNEAKRSISTVCIYGRLAVVANKEQEFVDVWRSRLAAAFITDGARRVDYANLGRTDTKATWSVLVHWRKLYPRLGPMPKWVVTEMRNNAILLRRSNWYFLNTSLYKEKDIQDL